MNCIIEGKSVKAFGKAIHALSRIGDELWLDPMVKGLAVRSVNSARSAAACFLFTPLFFQRYRLGTGPGPEQHCGTVKCNLAMKSVLPLFRCLASIERNVDRCEMSINIPDGRVKIQFYCRHGIVKTHNLGFCESEALQAVFTSHLCPNVIKAQARLLCDMVTHFLTSQEEITLSMTPLRLNLRNYCEEENNAAKMMCTETSLHPSEFDYYHVGVDSDITFCLKELRGFLSFAESHGLPVSVHFSASGKPVCFSVEDLVLEASVVLATLTDLDSRAPSQTTEPQASSTPRCGNAVNEPGVHRQADGSTHGRFPRTELIPSSQGSPPSQPAVLNSPEASRGRGVTDAGPADVVTTPASKVSFLLFGALSTQQGDTYCGSMQSVLACTSDTEDREE